VDCAAAHGHADRGPLHCHSSQLQPAPRSLCFATICRLTRDDGRAALPAVACMRPSLPSVPLPYQRQQPLLLDRFPLPTALPCSAMTSANALPALLQAIHTFATNCTLPTARRRRIVTYEHVPIGAQAPSHSKFRGMGWVHPCGGNIYPSRRSTNALTSSGERLPSVSGSA